MTVPHGHGERLVAHDLLHRPDIHPGHDEAGRTGVTERVPDDILDPGLVERRLIDPPVEILGVNMRHRVQ